jgi:hypothetical protein
MDSISTDLLQTNDYYLTPDGSRDLVVNVIGVTGQIGVITNDGKILFKNEEEFNKFIADNGFVKYKSALGYFSESESKEFPDLYVEALSKEELRQILHELDKFIYSHNNLSVEEIVQEFIELHPGTEEQRETFRDYVEAKLSGVIESVDSSKGNEIRDLYGNLWKVAGVGDGYVVLESEFEVRKFFPREFSKEFGKRIKFV